MRAFVKAQAVQELLALAGIGFILQAALRPPDYAVEYGRFLVVLIPRTKPTPTREFVARTHHFLELI